MGYCTDEEKIRDLSDGKVLENRDCTDWLMIIIWVVFLAAWIFVLIFGVVNGDPIRIILPENSRGDLCGDGDLESLNVSFIPLPNRITFTICTTTCPDILDYVCNNDPDDEDPTRRNDYFNTKNAEFVENQKLAVKCFITRATCTTAETAAANKFLGLIERYQQLKCFPALYGSTSFINRCLPNTLLEQNATLIEQFNSSISQLTTLLNNFEFTNFFTTGYSEVLQTWRVTLICTFSSILLSLFWVAFMRCFLAPLVYLTLILVFFLLIAVGIGAYLYANNLADVSVPGDSGAQDQINILRAIAFISWILAAIYVVIILFLISRIRISIILLEEASRCFQNNWYVIFLAPFIIVLLLGLTVFFVFSVAFIQSIVVRVNTTFSAPVLEFVNGFNLTPQEYNDNITAFETSIVNVSNVEQDVLITGLQAYNFFMYLWMANVFTMYGFFVFSMVSVTWYFSATGVEIDMDERGVEGGRQKSAPVGTLCRSMCLGATKHLGTVLFGALVIAIIQFIRALVLYIEYKFLDSWKNNTTVKILLYCVNCCLACIERCIKVISKTAFTICCIRNKNFCNSAFYGLSLLTSNILRVGTLTTLSTVTIFIIKLFIVGSNVAIGWGLMFVRSLTLDRPVASGLFPLLLIGFISFVMGTVFLVLFEAFVDAIMICFFVDEADFNSKYANPELAKVIGKFSDIESARREYEKKLT